MAGNRTFISYSWDSPEHKQWALAFAQRLQRDGVEARIDQLHLKLGDLIPDFMAVEIDKARVVLMIMTPKYKEKWEGTAGGVKVEGAIISASIYNKGDHRRFVPVLRDGSFADSMPTILGGKLGADLRGDAYNEEEYQRVLAHIREMSA